MPCLICLVCVWHWIEGLLTWAPWLVCHFQGLMCVMDSLIFHWIWHISRHTQPHITPHSHTQRHDDVCCHVPFALWVYGIGLRGNWQGPHGGRVTTQGQMCVMEFFLFLCICHISRLSQLLITPHSHTQRHDDVCCHVPFALCVYGIGLRGSWHGLHGWSVTSQGLMCVMD